MLRAASVARTEAPQGDTVLAKQPRSGLMLPGRGVSASCRPGTGGSERDTADPGEPWGRGLGLMGLRRPGAAGEGADGRQDTPETPPPRGHRRAELRLCLVPVTPSRRQAKPCP